MWLSDLPSFESFRSACGHGTAVICKVGRSVRQAALITSVLEDRAHLTVEDQAGGWKALVWSEGSRVHAIRLHPRPRLAPSQTTPSNNASVGSAKRAQGVGTVGESQ